MILLALLAAATSVQPDRPSKPVLVQARATVRIVAGVRITGDKPPTEALVRETKVSAPDGSETRLRLIEFP